MANNHRCPECGEWLNTELRNCKCGWKEAKTAAPTVADHRCIYHQAGLRCPYPGTISTSTHASTAWYCTAHYQYLNDTKCSLEILMNAEKNFMAVMEERIQWTVQLIQKEQAKAKKEIQVLYLKLFSKGKCA